MRHAAAALAASITLATFAPAALRAQPARAPHDVVRRAVEAAGGERALRGITSTTAEFISATYQLGQEETPQAQPRVAIATSRAVNDFAGDRRFAATEQRAGAQPARTRQVYAGGMAVFTNPAGAATVLPAANAAQVARGMRFAPQRLLLSALDNPAALARVPARTLRGETADGVRYALGPDTASLWFDRASGRLLAVETLTDDPVLGDRRDVTWYQRWQPVGTSGALLPRQQDAEVNGRLQQSIFITTLTANEAPADSLFAIPDSLRARAPRPDAAPAPVVVTMNQLAPGVWRAEGGSHFSLVVEQPTQIVLVEAPLNAQRTRALLDTLRGRFPNKPVGAVVATHHHWDHSGGLRAAMAAGLPIVAHRRLESFLRGVAAAPKTLAPDALSRTRRAPALRLLDDSLAVGTGDSRVVVHRMPTIHAEGLVAAHVPAAGILFTSDVLSPGPNAPAAAVREVVTFARDRGLRVERYAGGHGGTMTWEEMQRAAGQQ